MSLYRYKGRLLSLVEGSANILGETKMSLSPGSTFICAVDPVRDDEHQIEEFGEIKFERKRLHMIDIDTNINTSHKIQVLNLNSSDSYNWDSAKFCGCSRCHVVRARKPRHLHEFAARPGTQHIAVALV